MDGPRDDHTKSEVNRTERDTFYMISHICGILKIIEMNLFKKQKQIHTHRRQTYVYQSGRGEGIN